MTNSCDDHDSHPYIKVLLKGDANDLFLFSFSFCVHLVVVSSSTTTRSRSRIIYSCSRTRKVVHFQAWYGMQGGLQHWPSFRWGYFCILNTRKYITVCNYETNVYIYSYLLLKIRYLVILFLLRPKWKLLHTFCLCSFAHIVFWNLL